MLQLFAQSPQLGKLRATIADSQENATATTKPKTNIKGLTGSALSFVIADIFRKSESPFLFILNDKEEAA